MWREVHEGDRQHPCFNPHTYMRCDIHHLCAKGTIDVSIHTPTWGVTTRPTSGTVSSVVSIHTPTWGVTVNLILQSPVATVSIHTPTWGVTSLSSTCHSKSAVSIHTPTWGVTLCWITYYQPASLINYYANRYYFFDFTTQNCSINKLIYWFLTPAKLLFFL